jgi:hypothetical protein
MIDMIPFFAQVSQKERHVHETMSALPAVLNVVSDPPAVPVRGDGSLPL